MDNLTTVILAGGLGSRLRSAVADRPKVLAEVNGRPFLAYLLDQLVVAGCQHVVLCTGYLGEQIESAFGSTYRSLEIAYSQEHAPLGTGGALRQALALCRSNPILAMNGDSFCDADFGRFYTWYKTQNITTGALLLTQVDNVERYGQVQIDTGEQIVAFNEKGAQSGAGWINAGVYLLDQTMLNSLPWEQPISIEKDVFPNWIPKGLYGFRNTGRFIDIGLPETYRAAANFFATR